MDAIVSDVVARAVRLVAPERIWLFGSWVKGTATRASDVDLAMEGAQGGARRWALFATEAREEVPALVDLDLVDLDHCPPRLAHEIRQTGRVVYERVQ